jgi:phenylalanyl-tRNA synthetase alpha chain
MIEEINNVRKEIEKIEITNVEQLENFRIKYLSKKGKLSDFFDWLKTAKPDQKKELGKPINELKNILQNTYEYYKAQFDLLISGLREDTDLTLPGISINIGTKHPLTLIQEELIGIFRKFGFAITDGPEIEDDWHNFSALNFPDNHPARDMQDTFFIDKDIALRTHTSSVQVRYMEKNKPPMRVIMPGRVYRNEAISARANCFFHQIEGLYIDENVSFADLKQTLYYFVKELFGETVKIRFRPSYFPFTEPSAEMDINCRICAGVGCNVCKHSGWVEILGCGMVDPEVLTNCGIDSEKYNGYAFGLGVERVAMLKYDVKDLRIYFENDLRFLNQFNTIS